MRKRENMCEIKRINMVQFDNLHASEYIFIILKYS